MQFNEAVVKNYEDLQTFAMAFEQVTSDMKCDRCPLAPHFEKLGKRLNLLLCELQHVMIERQIGPTRTVQRADMPDEYRKVNSQTGRDIRNFVIFKNYLRALEYLVQVMEHLKKTASQEV